MRKPWIAIIAIGAIVLTLAAFGYYRYLGSTNNAVLDDRWATFDDSSETSVDNSVWQQILDDYLVTDTNSGVYLFDYEGLLDDGRESIDGYVELLESTDPLKLNRQEQKSYWINLYNAATVQLIIDNYPLNSITTLGNNPVDFGPWNDDAVTVNDIDLSLNDVEHRIIRPLYNDYRIHFGVNCASIGCPDLATTAYNAEQIDQQLDDAAARYLAHPRGLRIENGKLHLSTLFEWYSSDFGESLSEVLTTLGKHTPDNIRTQLAEYAGEPEYAYDWSLNGYCSEEGGCGQ